MNNNIIYVRGRGEELVDLITAFQTAGFTLRSTRTIEDVILALDVSPLRAIIIDASADDSEIAERSIELGNAPELHSVPIIFIGRKIRDRLAVLMNQFELLIPVEYPFNADTIIRTFASAEAQRPELSPAEEVVSTANVVLGRNDPLSGETSLGGGMLLRGRSVDDFDEDSLLPNTPYRAAVENALDGITNLDEQLGLSARRTGYLAATVADREGIDEKQRSSIQTGSLLLHWGAAESDTEIPDFGILVSSSGGPNQHLSDMLRLSADLVAQRVTDVESAKVIDAVAQLVAGRGEHLPSELKEQAECILLAEVTQTSCIRNGRWDHFGAQRALKMMRSSSLVSSEALKVAYARSLGEAILMDETPKRLYRPALTSRQYSENARKISEAAEHGRKISKGRKTKTVRLFELLPGARLAEPLVTNDNVVLVPAEIVVDRELLVRIIELASVRPVRDPIIVLDDEDRNIEV
jgi:hypothetical protein